ncbi:MAG TPA: molybdopterin-dependent oxidoreductase [Cytophagaceae bacterium]|nr:molybdopterin-dependent oxidoreductase [Cytophagaceae bacterium]
MKKQLLVLVLLFCLQAPVLRAQTAACIKVEGEVTTPLTLCAEEFAKMKHTEAIMKDRDGKEYRYSGVPVSEILKQAGATVGKDLRGENLSKYLLVKAADGYEVLFSLAELDSTFTDRVVILADQLEGKPLPAGKGPFRIIVPGEKKPARCAFEVTRLIVRFSSEH